MATTAHITQQILDALAATIVAASTAAGASVYVDHPDELTAAMLPAIVITAGPEQIEAMGMGFPFAQDRRMAVDIISVCTGSGAAAASRALAAQVEAALYASESTARLGGLAKSPLLLQSADPTVSGQASQLIAEVRQGWQVLYQTASGAPTVAT
jgi:hypothetical protein